MVVEDCVAVHHLGVEGGVPGEQPHEVSEVGVGDVLT